ncbi:chemotaxis protein CheW [Sphingomonas sp. BIUV-7]|uniref:Chemotaxis protein CheW n=1 Tax=Sphingomonas natans TaxID=3063330 RepID=A0ABT8Y4L9_9SPHN|nr:chemotaxis protein CheW [Sphingomonas sp. BIUV-7]MDO6413253.1 chemotaxis protein CheW [Sphingomonas sp. BIUV-7]
MERLYLMVRIAGELVAIDANEVGSVVEIDNITRVPRVAPHIAGLFALRSRVLTVIDSRAALGLGKIEGAVMPEAVVILIDGHSYALLVEAVEDVASAGAPSPLVAKLEPGWARVAIGRLGTERGDILLIDPAQLILGGEEQAAAA